VLPQPLQYYQLKRENIPIILRPTLPAEKGSKQDY
jgi:hypothetical protein